MNANEQKARELLVRIRYSVTSKEEHCACLAELTTLITKAEALDWIEEHGQWNLFQVVVRGLKCPADKTILTAIQQAMKGDK